MDSERPFEEQDLRIADLVEREGRALVIGMSKADLVEQRSGAFKTLREQADHWLPQVKVFRWSRSQALPARDSTG